MMTLDRLLANARRGEGSIVDVVGEPGIGKSRLIAETYRHAADFRVLDVVCQAYEASTPYLVVRQLLLEALDLADADARKPRGG